MVTLEQKEQYIAELRMIVERWPKSFVGCIDSKGMKKSTSNRQYLRDFIKEETPLLDSPEYKMGTKLYWILNGITSWDDPRVCCRQCGKSFIGKNVASVREGYVRFCSRRCQYDSPEVKNKTERTCLKKYGVTNPSKSELVTRKISETKSKNNTFCRSIPEEQAYGILSLVFPDLCRQYYSDEYPFRCDFYSPTRNLFMECHFNWLHGKQFYYPDDEFCKRKPDFWREKSKTCPQYVSAIETWTDRDVKKREIAEKNHLNYLVFWNLKEVVEYARKFGLDDETIDAALDGVVQEKSHKCIHSSLELFNKHGMESLNKFKTWKFPFYQVGDSLLNWEINALSTKTLSDNQYSPLVRKYHRSVWSCSEKGRMSPIEYWEKFKEVTDEEWKKFYLSRLRIARSKAEKNGVLKPWVIREGIVNCKQCHCVSYLKPFLAKRLIQTYLSDASEIFCPMNGFSGFMLGASLGCNLRYIGQDINERQILEAKELASFLERSGKVSLGQISLLARDMFEDSGRYDCLVVCPPYGDKEMWNFDFNGVCTDRNLPCEKWMDEILSRYTCRKYLFVVDGEEDTKYDDHIVERLSNRSHFSENFEKVIVMS